MEIVQTWERFKKMIGENRFNIGKGSNSVDIPKELLYILNDSNGQKTNYKPIFIEFKNNIFGMDIFQYNFISYEDILNLKEEMSGYTNEDNLFPFAAINRQIGDKGTVVFAISNFDKKIYKIQFYSWDRFGSHIEFKEELFANSLNEFIENQILWHNLL